MQPAPFPSSLLRSPVACCFDTGGSGLLMYRYLSLLKPQSVSLVGPFNGKGILLRCCIEMQQL